MTKCMLNTLLDFLSYISFFEPHSGFTPPSYDPCCNHNCQNTSLNLLINTFLAHFPCTICLQAAPIVFTIWAAEFQSLSFPLFLRKLELSFKGNELRTSLDMPPAALFPLWAFALHETCALLKHCL